MAFSNSDIQSYTESLIWRTYSFAGLFAISRQVKLINKDKFVKLCLDENSETFVVHVVAMKILDSSIHSTSGFQLAVLQQTWASIEISSLYTDYADVFSAHLVMILPKYNNINRHATKRMKMKQTLYGSIYRLCQVELKSLKT